MERQRIERQRIVAEARRWIGTPYRHQASMAGAGADCLGLVRGVWRAVVGAEPEAAGAYTADWAEATDEDRLAEAGRRHFTACAPEERQAGDVVLFRFRPGAPAKHAAILVAADRFVHAYEGTGVVETDLTPWWRRRLAFVFRFPGIDD